MDRSLPPAAAILALPPGIVEGCLNLDHPTDQVFARALHGSLAALSPAERRGALAGVTGHVAESVVEVLLAELGYQLLWHFAGPGQHGVDLVVLCPAGDRVVAVEVKGTLRRGYWPRLSRRELVQFSDAWVDKADNPGMANWELRSSDVYGMVVLVNFPAMAYRAAVTADFQQLQPVRTVEQLGDLDWLT
jgi:hypothetical protein